MEKIIHAYSMMQEQLKTGKIDEHFFEYANLVFIFAENAGNDVKKQMAEEIYNIVSQQENMALVLSMHSYILQLDTNSVYLESMLSIIRNLQKNCRLAWQNAYFYFGQLNRFRLKYNDCDTPVNRNLLSELLHRGIISCVRQLNIAIRPLPYKERDNSHVAVLTEEFINDNSEHRETVLECCYQLQKIYGKKVLLINTAESISKVGEVGFFGAEYGKEDSNLRQQTQLEWKGEHIDYYQCTDVLSELTYIENIIKKILEYNPAMIFHIGSTSILSGIMDEWIPVMSIESAFGRQPVSGTEFHAAYENRLEMKQQFLIDTANYEQIIQDEGNLKARLIFPADYFKAESRNVIHYECKEWDSYTITGERKKVWAVELCMLEEIQRICKKYDITYYAYKGTLLGTVKYHGFIPWDDDIDIAMKREDYQKFASVAPRELESRYKLMDAAISPEWESFKIQIVCADNTNEKIYRNNINIGHLPAVDIAVLDYLPADAKCAEEKKDTLRIIFELADQFERELIPSEYHLQKFYKMKAEFKGTLDETRSLKNQMIYMQQKIAECRTEDASSQLFHSTDYYRTRKWCTFQKKWFDSNNALEFENKIIPVPENYSEILELCGYEDWQNQACRMTIQKENFAIIDSKFYDEEDLRNYKQNFFDKEDRNIHFTGYILKDCFYIESMMKRAWAASIKVLKEVERICRKFHLSYFADWGTLLGTIRHKGFIPWDDDIDIAMKREDYEQFIALAREHLPEGYCIVDAVHDENWSHGVTRVLNTSDINNAKMMLFTERCEEFFGCPYLVGVDIFPMDYIPRNKEEEDLQMNMLTIASSLSSSLEKNNNQITEEFQQDIKKLENLCHYNFTNEISLLHQSLRLEAAICQMYEKADGDFLTEMYSHRNRWDYGCEYRLKPEWFKETVSLPFETTTIEVSKYYMLLLLFDFGKDWKIGCFYASHEYPFYRRQQRQLEKNGFPTDLLT